MPAAVQAYTIRQANRARQPAVVYLHPYELAVNEVEDFRRAGYSMSWSRRVTQSLRRSRVAPRLSRLLQGFSFAPMGEVLALHTGVQVCSAEEFTPASGAAPAAVGA